MAVTFGKVSLCLGNRTKAGIEFYHYLFIIFSFKNKMFRPKYCFYCNIVIIVVNVQ